ncbi:MAG: carboxypeptidase regulatory-like domain-containing protein, partial [Myxococcales bacterium]|nr:carboxypeptidase regulatory-like domain-containing protein [Myxococcales bacterium]
RLPDPDSHFVIEGVLVRQRGDEETLPLSGANVVLLSEDTGLAVSTASETTEGRFSLRLPPVPDEYTLSVTSSSSGDTLPTLRLEGIPIDETTDLGEVIAGAWDDPLPVEGIVEGVNGEIRRVEGATVFLEQEVEAGTFSRVAFADSRGEFAATVLPGHYHVTLVPPVDLLYGARSFETEVTDSTPLEFEVNHKPNLVGVVVDRYGRAVSESQISLTPLSFDVQTLALGPANAESDSSGLFLVRSHAGPQRVVVVPPSDSGTSPLLIEDYSLTR